MRGKLSAAAKVAAAAAKHKRDFDPRTAMPLCAAWIDDMRDVFGAPAGIKASEGGKTITWGRQIEGRWVVPVMDDFGRSARKAENAFKRARPNSGMSAYTGAP